MLIRLLQVCVRSNHTEARTMLLDNPQLAYALLQAQVLTSVILQFVIIFSLQYLLLFR